MNVIYDKIKPDNRPRLKVVLEYRNEADSFRDGELANFDQKKQKAIKDKFVELVGMNLFGRYSDTNLFVVFAAFEPAALNEAVSKISEANFDELKEKLGCTDIWTIRPFGSSLTIFFYTEIQLTKLKTREFERRCINEFVKLAKKFDEFNYVSKDTLPITFDTKSNFDSNYKSSWFKYYR